MDRSKWMQTSLLRRLFIFLCFTATSLLLHAKDVPHYGEGTSRKGYDIEAQMSTRFSPRANLRNQGKDTDFSSQNYRMRIDYDYLLETGVAGFVTWFDYGRYFTEDTVDAFKSRYATEDYTFSAYWNHHCTEEFGFIARWGSSFSRVLSNPLNSSFNKGYHAYLAFGPGWKVSEDLSIALGLAYWSRLERNGLWLPFFDVRWAMCSNWTLSLTQDIEALRAQVAYDVMGKGKVFADLGLGYHMRSYSLMKDNAGKASLSDSAYVLEIGTKVHVGESYYFRPYGQAIFNRKISAYRNGHKRSSISSRDLHTAYALGLEGVFVF